MFFNFSFLRRKGVVRANCDCSFYPLFFHISNHTKKTSKSGKYGINSSIDLQIHAGITSEVLPPLAYSLTHFRDSDLIFL